MTGRDKLIKFLTREMMVDDVPECVMREKINQTLMTYDQERARDKGLSLDAFEGDCRKRAEMGLNWQVAYNKPWRRDYLIDCFEYSIVSHRIEDPDHKEVFREPRLAILAKRIDEVDSSVRSSLSFWNGVDQV